MPRPSARPAGQLPAAVAVLDDGAAGGPAPAGGPRRAAAVRTAPRSAEGSRAAWEASERPGMVALGLAAVSERARHLGWLDGRDGRQGRRALSDVPRHLFGEWLAGWMAGWARRVRDVGGEVPPAPTIRGPRGPRRGGARAA